MAFDLDILLSKLFDPNWTPQPGGASKFDEFLHSLSPPGDDTAVFDVDKMASEAYQGVTAANKPMSQLEGESAVLSGLFRLVWFCFFRGDRCWLMN